MILLNREQTATRLGFQDVGALTDFIRAAVDFPAPIVGYQGRFHYELNAIDDWVRRHGKPGKYQSIDAIQARDFLSGRMATKDQQRAYRNCRTLARQNHWQSTERIHLKGDWI